MLVDLLGSKVGNLKPHEVGVLPATRKQTEKIRKTLRLKGLGTVDVGSVEEVSELMFIYLLIIVIYLIFTCFQAHGKEFRVVVLSCVSTARGLRSLEQDVRLHFQPCLHFSFSLFFDFFSSSLFISHISCSVCTTLDIVQMRSV